MTRKWPRTSEETRAVLGTRPPIFFPLSPRLPRHGSARRREERAGRGEKRRTLIKGWRWVTGEPWVTPIGFHSDDIRDRLPVLHCYGRKTNSGGGRRFGHPAGNRRCIAIRGLRDLAGAEWQ